MAQNNSPKIITTHDYIRIAFGNNRNLTCSYSGIKASGSVPGNVINLWAKVHEFDALSLAQIGLGTGTNHKEVVEEFVRHIDTIWPTWNVGPKIPAIGKTVTFDFGKRRGGVDTGEVKKVRGTTVSVHFKRQGLISMAADMLHSE